LSRQGHPSTPLTVFCAASNREVMQTIARDYEREYGVRIEFQFGPSQTLLTSIEVSGEGDLYLPADESYLQLAATKKIVTKRISLARMHVVLGVPKGNPKGIHQFADLLRPDVRVVQANPDVAAVGKLTRETLTPSGKWTDLHDRTTAFVSTVTEAANSVQAGAADVSLVYDAVLTTYPDLEVCEIEEFRETFAEIQIGIVSQSAQPALARHFAKYLSASDRGLERYRELGFRPVQGAIWGGEPLP